MLSLSFHEYESLIRRKRGRNSFPKGHKGGVLIRRWLLSRLGLGIGI
jgi:hypothetical protein